MLKALLKKQFLELNASYFQNKKTGKMRSKLSTVLYISLFVLIFIGLGFIFYELASMFAPLLYTDMDWLFFCLMGMLGLAYGTLGSIFNTYASLYRAKDNDQLLSMPIPPSRILFVRILGVAALGLLYEAMVMVPTFILRLVSAPVTAAVVISYIVLIFVITVFVTVLSCFLGWVVALISGKLKSKSLLVVLLSLIFLAAYYYFFSQAYSVVASLVANSEKVGSVIHTWLYPFYLMGRGAEGHIPSLLLFTFGVLALFAITWWLLSGTFIGIATGSKSRAKAEYKSSAVKSAGVGSALFRREWKHFSSSPTYMLNCSLGTFFMPAAAIFLLIKHSALQEVLQIFGSNMGFLTVIAAAGMCMLISMNDITAPSISIEGKSIWILRTLPVSTKKIFLSKAALHLSVTVPPALFAAVCLCLCIGLESADFAAVVIFTAVYCVFSALGGLVINLIKPNLEWTNETVPIKQSAGVLIVLLGGWFLAAVIGGGGYFLMKLIPPCAFVFCCAALLAVCTLLLYLWLCRRGAEIFESL